MINVKKFIFDEMKNNTTLSWYVWDRIFPQVVPLNASFPSIVYNRIGSWKIDTKWIRNEYFQITTWGKSVSQNEAIMSAIISIFNWLKKTPVKYVDITRIDESFDSETQTFWNHVSIHIKLFEV